MSSSETETDSAEDDNKFAELAGELEGDEPIDNGDEETTETGDQNTNSPSRETEHTQSSQDADTNTRTSVEESSRSGEVTRELDQSSPPFTFDRTTQDQIYLQDGRDTDFDDLKADVEHVLRREFDVRNVEKREIDTAIIELVLKQYSAIEIAEEVVSNRGFNPKRESR